MRTADYGYYVNGVLQAAGLKPTNKDWMTVELEEGKLKAKVYANNVASPYVFHEANYDTNVKLYPVFFIVSSDIANKTRTVMTRLFFMRNGYGTSIDTPLEINDGDDIEIVDEDEFIIDDSLVDNLLDNGDSIGVDTLLEIGDKIGGDTLLNIVGDNSIPTIGASPPTNYTGSKTKFNTIDWQTQDLADFLGFSQTKQPFQEADGNVVYTSNVASQSIITYDSLVVELLSIELDSFDSQTHKRQNILAVLPNIQSTGSKMNYNAPYPLYISMKNRNEFSLRNIKARILNADLDDIEVQGKTTMTLLIKNSTN